MFRVSLPSLRISSAETGGGQQHIRFDLLDIVRLEKAHPEVGLAKGVTGTIVECFETPVEAYEVEFLDEAGELLAELAVDPSEISRLNDTR